MNYKKSSVNKLFKIEYMYFDILDKQYALDLFKKENIKVKFKNSYKSTDNKFIIRVCEISKKNECKFIQVMNKLHNKILLCRYDDYDEFCYRILNMTD